MFESVEEADQIEAEPKNEEAKQLPKMPNGALQNETSSPDSGHPSSRNFSVTSGLSDGSLSTEDSTAAVPQTSQSPVKHAVIENEAATEEMDNQVKFEMEKEQAPTKSTMAEVIHPPEVKTSEETSLQTDTQQRVEEAESAQMERIKFDNKDLDTNSKGIKSGESGDRGKEVSGQDRVMGLAAAAESEQALVEPGLKKEVVSFEETSKLKEKRVEKMKEQDESKTAKPQGIVMVEEKKKISAHSVASEAQTNSVVLADMRDSKERETYYAYEKDEAQVMTESDESPSAIEMEEIPKVKVSMVPWSRKGGCEALSSSEESTPHIDRRPDEEQGKPSPEGTESILSEEPEMESLYPHFDALAGDTKNKPASQEPAGSTFSVCTYIV